MIKEMEIEQSVVPPTN